MKAEIVSVGTELLMGQIANTDAQYLSKQLNELGIDVYYHNVVGDNKVRLKELLTKVLERSDIIITTGGIGPTQDDLTKETIAEYFGLEMIVDEASLKKNKKFF
jgi:nicotinamide-nucleotide amidase